MKNIFENAYFGKPYKTRDGRKAIYWQYYNNRHYLVTKDFTVVADYDNNGVSSLPVQKLDIVSEWNENIDEDELDKLADELNPYEFVYDSDNASCWDEGFKTGYRRAKQ